MTSMKLMGNMPFLSTRRPTIQASLTCSSRLRTSPACDNKVIHCPNGVGNTFCDVLATVVPGGQPRTGMELFASVRYGLLFSETVYHICDMETNSEKLQIIAENIFI